MTLNQIVNRLEKLALSHKQLHHFYFGDVVQWLARQDVKYPACFVDLNAGGIDRGERLTTYNFEVMFCDLADVAENTKSNELEVLSDLTSIAEDYKAMLANSEFTDGEIADSSSLQFYKEKFEDVVVAVGMSIKIQSRFDSNRCRVPADGVTFETPTDTDMSIINNFIYVGVGNEGNEITTNSLKGKTIVFAMKGDKTVVLGANENNLAENEYFLYPLTGRVKFGSDIEATQIIQLLNR